MLLLQCARPRIFPYLPLRSPTHKGTSSTRSAVSSAPPRSSTRPIKSHSDAWPCHPGLNNPSQFADRALVANWQHALRFGPKQLPRSSTPSTKNSVRAKAHATSPPRTVMIAPPAAHSSDRVRGLGSEEKKALPCSFAESTSQDSPVKGLQRTMSHLEHERRYRQLYQTASPEVSAAVNSQSSPHAMIWHCLCLAKVERRRPATPLQRAMRRRTVSTRTQRTQ